MKNRMMIALVMGLLLGLMMPASVYAGEPEGKSVLVQHLTQEEFMAKVFNYKEDSNLTYLGDLPAIVDFYADWCVPCQRLAPVLEELAKEYEGRIVIYKVNTDQQRQLAVDFGIQALPTMLFIPVKGEPQVQKGSMPKKNLKQLIETILLK